MYLSRYMPNVRAVEGLQDVRAASIGLSGGEHAERAVREMTEEIYRERRGDD